MIENELELERLMVARGRQRYYAETLEAEQEGRGMETSYSRILLATYFKPLTDEIIRFSQKSLAGGGGKYKRIIRSLPAEQLAFFTLRSVLNSLMQDKAAISVSSHIGLQVENERKFLKFQNEHPGLLEFMHKRWTAAGTSDYMHKARAITALMDKKDVEYISWTNQERAGLGLVLLGCLIRAGGFIQLKKTWKGNKTYLHVEPEPEFLSWLLRHTEVHSLLHPDFMPMLTPPVPHGPAGGGGYLMPELRVKCKIVKTWHKEQRALITKGIPVVTECINHLQATPWSLNPDTTPILKSLWSSSKGPGLPQLSPYTVPDCPIDGKVDLDEHDKEILQKWKRQASAIYTREKERQAKCITVSRVVRMEGVYSGRAFYFPYKCDFRGRLYTASAGLALKARTSLRRHSDSPKECP